MHGICISVRMHCFSFYHWDSYCVKRCRKKVILCVFLFLSQIQHLSILAQRTLGWRMAHRHGLAEVMFVMQGIYPECHIAVPGAWAQHMAPCCTEHHWPVWPALGKTQHSECLCSATDLPPGLQWLCLSLLPIQWCLPASSPFCSYGKSCHGTASCASWCVL